MWIRFNQAPAYVCENKEYHPDDHLKVFVGVVLDATLNKEGTMYQVPLKDVLVALSRARAGNLLEVAYWSDHWLRIGLSLHDSVYFPAESCEVIED